VTFAFDLTLTITVILLLGINLPGESGKMGVNEDFFFSGGETESSGIVDIRRNDGMSSSNSSSSSSTGGSGDRGSVRGRDKSKGRDGDNEDDDDDDDDLQEILEQERSLSDSTYSEG
jgi:hypothetical protein